MNAKSRYTPAPWHYTDEKINDVGSSYRGIVGNSCTFAHVTSVNNVDEIEANARLIAAAPELLGLLKEVIDQASDEGYINLLLGKKIESAIEEVEGGRQ